MKIPTKFFGKKVENRQIPAWVIQFFFPELAKRGYLMIYMALVEYQNWNTCLSRPGHRRIREFAGCGNDLISAALQWLTDQGLIIKVSDGQDRKATVYKIVQVHRNAVQVIDYKRAPEPEICAPEEKQPEPAKIMDTEPIAVKTAASGQKASGAQQGYSTNNPTTTVRVLEIFKKKCPSAKVYPMQVARTLEKWKYSSVIEAIGRCNKTTYSWKGVEWHLQGVQTVEDRRRDQERDEQERRRKREELERQQRERADFSFRRGADGMFVFTEAG